MGILSQWMDAGEQADVDAGTQASPPEQQVAEQTLIQAQLGADQNRNDALLSFLQIAPDQNRNAVSDWDTDAAPSTGIGDASGNKDGAAVELPNATDNQTDGAPANDPTTDTALATTPDNSQGQSPALKLQSAPAPEAGGKSSSQPDMVVADASQNVHQNTNPNAKANDSGKPSNAAPQTAKQLARMKENQADFENPNVKALLNAISTAEGGGYDFKYGAVKDKVNDPWRFTDFSTHPGAGKGGNYTAAGMYQITRHTWEQHGEKLMGLTDFSPDTQNLIAVDLLRSAGVIDKIKNGDIAGSISAIADTWNSLPKGPNLPNRVPNQRHIEYDDFLKSYSNFGGKVQ